VALEEVASIPVATAKNRGYQSDHIVFQYPEIENKHTCKGNHIKVTTRHELDGHILPFASGIGRPYDMTCGAFVERVTVARVSRIDLSTDDRGKSQGQNGERESREA
jgi:hypothetical protein